MNENNDTLSFTPIYNKHYIAVDGKNRVVFGWSDAYPVNVIVNDATTICINDKGGVPFKLTIDGEENPIIYNESGIPLYKWSFSSKKVLPRTEKEINADTDPVSFPDAESVNTGDTLTSVIDSDDISPGTEPDPPA